MDKNLEKWCTLERAQNNRIYPKGTIYIALSASDGIAHQLQEDNYISDRYALFIPKTKYINVFYEIFCESFKPFYQKYNQGINFAFDNFKFFDFPEIDTKQIEEMEEALKEINNLIYNERPLIQQMKGFKNFCLNKMFPKNGEKIPEILFPEFSGDWEQRKLGEVAEYKKGFAFKSEDYIDNGIKIIRVSDLGKDTIKETGEVCILPEKSKQYEPWILRENDLIVTTVGSKPPVWDSLVGKAIYVSQMFDGSLLNQNAIRIRVKSGNNQVFLRYIFTKDYVDYLQTIIRGNANQGSITVEDLFKYNFRICSLKEQEKIGSFFAQLDNTITLHQRKLDTLKTLKKGLLQNMFV